MSDNYPNFSGPELIDKLATLTEKLVRVRRMDDSFEVIKEQVDTLQREIGCRPDESEIRMSHGFR
jgi:hypothetical protein